MHLHSWKGEESCHHPLGLINRYLEKPCAAFRPSVISAYLACLSSYRIVSACFHSSTFTHLCNHRATPSPYVLPGKGAAHQICHLSDGYLPAILWPLSRAARQACPTLEHMKQCAASPMAAVASDEGLHWTSMRSYESALISCIFWACAHRNTPYRIGGATCD